MPRSPGSLLWLAGLIGGWCENFAVYHRIPASIAQHPLGLTIGAGRMQKLADWVDRNIGPWSTSISLGYLLGFMPVFFEFFGLPLDVRHVTLNTGMFAFAAARFGPSAFGQIWLYSAMVGIAMMFVLIWESALPSLLLWRSARTMWATRNALRFCAMCSGK